MNCESTTVAAFGAAFPPGESTMMRSKILNDAIVSSTVTRNIVGRRPGSVTLQNRWMAFAPSTRAAS
jgi:hypothetical protein